MDVRLRRQHSGRWNQRLAELSEAKGDVPTPRWLSASSSSWESAERGCNQKSPSAIRVRLGESRAQVAAPTALARHCQLQRRLTTYRTCIVALRTTQGCSDEGAHDRKEQQTPESGETSCSFAGRPLLGRNHPKDNSQNQGDTVTRDRASKESALTRSASTDATSKRKERDRHCKKTDKKDQDMNAHLTSFGSS